MRIAKTRSKKKKIMCIEKVIEKELQKRRKSLHKNIINPTPPLITQQELDRLQDLFQKKTTTDQLLSFLALTFTTRIAIIPTDDIIDIYITDVYDNIPSICIFFPFSSVRMDLIEDLIDFHYTRL